MSKTPRLLLALVASLLLASCAARTVRIADLKSQPARFDNKTVTVAGMVTRTFGLPLVPFRFYTVDDGTGDITVLSTSTSSPRQGSQVTVKAKVSDVAELGGRPLGLHLREEGRKNR